jgi:hypothetical protein
MGHELRVVCHEMSYVFSDFEGFFVTEVHALVGAQKVTRNKGESELTEEICFSTNTIA